MNEFDKIWEENRRRNAARDVMERFDPIHGVGCSGDRTEVGPEDWTEGREFVPREMLADPKYPSARTSVAWTRLRCRYDFEYWAAKCCKIRDKDTCRDVPFILNRPQRRVVKILEADRRAGRPMRMIILKARQWGGSTVVEMYIAWIQLVFSELHIDALVCGREKGGSQVVLNLYSDMLARYPLEFWEGEKAPKLKTSRGILQLEGRENRIYVAASTNADAVRGVNVGLVHLTEAAYWKATKGTDPADTVRSIYGAVAVAPMTLVVMESTADGVGSFFHEEWCRAVAGSSDKRPVFVAWHEIGKYSLRFPPGYRGKAEAEKLYNSLDDYEMALWTESGLTLEQINWYHHKRREFSDHTRMKSEFPSTAQEAFTSSTSNVFSIDKVELLRRGCSEPIAYGDVTSASGVLSGPLALKGVAFRRDPAGALDVWEMPEQSGSYVVAVDIGGLSENADWSVIAVLRRGGRPTVAAQWRGHIDHDLLAWKAAMIAKLYNSATLVFESNTLESERRPDGEIPTGQGAYILNELYRHYRNLYRRRQPGRSSCDRIPGFHTNKQTKGMIITELIAAVRDGGYTERDLAACDELATYERLPNGSYAARTGRHDDILMTRAIGLHVSRELEAGAAGDPALTSYLALYD